MSVHDHFMQRCVQLAQNGAGSVAPNPMVGALLVQDDRVLAEGWHRSFGGPHAEVECLRAFGDGPVPGDAIMYVNLEPCSHHGKTPPCIDLLIARGVKHLVIGCTDPNPLVKGRGIARAREAGIEVTLDILCEECRWLNRRFIQGFQQQRPYIILKWARSADGYLDDHGRTARISSPETDVLVHRWRSEEQAILVGSRTVINDDPALTVRLVEGKNPLRVLIDRTNTTPAGARIFDGTAPTLLTTGQVRGDVRAGQEVTGKDSDPIDAVLSRLHRERVISVLIEGGAELLGHFFRKCTWDEARVITGTARFGAGTASPVPPGTPARTRMSGSDRIDLFVNGSKPGEAWPW